MSLVDDCDYLQLISLFLSLQLSKFMSPNSELSPASHPSAVSFTVRTRSQVLTWEALRVPAQAFFLTSPLTSVAPCLPLCCLVLFHYALPIFPEFPG